MISRLTLCHRVRLFGLGLYEARLTLAAQPAPSEIVDVTMRHQALGFLWIRRFRRTLTELGLADPLVAKPIEACFMLDPESDAPFLVAHASILERMRAASAHQVIALRREPRVAGLELERAAPGVAAA